MKNIYLKVDGIHCTGCEIKIKSALLKTNNIKDIEFLNGFIKIKYQEELNKDNIVKIITDLGYKTNVKYFNTDFKKIKSRKKITEFFLLFFLVLLILFLIDKVFKINIFNIVPKIDSNASYLIIFITGLVTSIHCVGMCGAINLFAVSGKDSKALRPILYNIGRITSYTITGAIVGLIGNVISINSKITGIIILISSILMILMALGMLEIIKFRIPKFISIRSKSKSSFVIGLLNGLMPCGPLQAMQIYALSTGSIIKGALSMFLFGVGTIPLMLLFGISANMFSSKGINIINKIAPMLLLVLSIFMLNRSLISFNVDVSKIFDNYKGYESSVLESNYQVIEFDLKYDGYEDIIIQKGIPVKMIINVSKDNLTICNEELKIKEFNIVKKLEVGKNIIEFTPNKKGTFIYTCWMDMIKNNIKVVDDINHFKEVKINE